MAAQNSAIVLHATTGQPEGRPGMTAELDAEELRGSPPGPDPHRASATGPKLRSRSPVRACGSGTRKLAQRVAAKAANFGSIYGMSAKGLSAAAWSGYGIELTESDAKLALDRFFTKYWASGSGCARQRQVQAIPSRGDWRRPSGRGCLGSVTARLSTAL